MLRVFRPLVRQDSLPIAAAGAAAAFAAALALAALSYQLLERPILDAVHRRTSGKPRVSEPPSPEPELEQQRAA
jgi:peptidoglycan/LPS O-acetylase OafA/YrhL